MRHLQHNEKKLGLFIHFNLKYVKKIWLVNILMYSSVNINYVKYLI